MHTGDTPVPPGRTPLAIFPPCGYILPHAADHDGHGAVRGADFPSALRVARHEMAALVTAPRAPPSRPRSRRRPARLREIAREHNTPILDPEDVNTAEAQARLAALAADLLVVCDYGQILAPKTLAAARLGGINLHASLLPKYRGAAPINWAIYHGETRDGRDGDPHDAATRRRAVHRPGRASPIGPDETAVELEAAAGRRWGGAGPPRGR